MRLSKLKKRYGFLMYNKQQKLPKEIEIDEVFIIDEREFTAFIILNEYIQRKLGITNLTFRGNIYPDIKGNVLYYGEEINIELEYNSSNFRLHKHSIFGIHLILSFIRPEKVRTIKGIPVWSFYKYSKKQNKYVYCLEEDMNYVGEDKNEL